MKKRLKRIGLPATFHNLFVRSSLEIEDMEYDLRMEKMKQMMYDRMLTMTIEGVPWSEAASRVLLRDNKDQ